MSAAFSRARDRAISVSVNLSAVQFNGRRYQTAARVPPQARTRDNSNQEGVPRKGNINVMAPTSNTALPNISKAIQVALIDDDAAVLDSLGLYFARHEVETTCERNAVPNRCPRVSSRTEIRPEFMNLKRLGHYQTLSLPYLSTQQDAFCGWRSFNCNKRRNTFPAIAPLVAFLWRGRRFCSVTGTTSCLVIPDGFRDGLSGGLHRNVRTRLRADRSEG
jgi:hypothetical protein